MGSAMLVAMAAVTATVTHAAGHLPRAYLPAPPDGSNNGDANTPAAQTEINAMAERLLKDPDEKNWPWAREVVNASDHGARPNDGVDDVAALRATISAACARSAVRLAQYRNRTASDPTLPRLPDGPDDRPVLVEVRFDPGLYDLSTGLFTSTQQLNGCGYLLLNGQNATMVAHPPPGWAAQSDRIDRVGWLIACEQCTHVAVYNFVFDTAEPATTMGVVRTLLTNSSGGVVGVEITAAPGHAVWTDNFTTVQPVLPDGAFDLYGVEAASYAGWPGATTAICGPSCMKVWFLPPGAPNPVGQGGQADTSHMAVGQHLGFVRGYTIGVMQADQSNVTVVQSVRSVGIGAGIRLYGTGVDADIIDVHNDRLWPSPMFVWNDGHGWPGQTTKTGRIRIWHTSIEGGSDDLVDDLASEADVVAVHPANRTVDVLALHGRYNGSCTPYFQPIAGVPIEIGHAADPYTPFATLTVATIAHLPCGVSVTFVEPLPGELVVGDFASAQQAPTLLHVKNVRTGNHLYNQFNVKAHAMLFEQSFFYNTTMAAIDISTDSSYWYEGPRANNINVTGCTFARCAAAISIATTSWAGPGPTDAQVAPNATHNVTLQRNWIYLNETTRAEWESPAVVLGAVAHLDMRDNIFRLEPGMRRDLPLISLCNVWNTSITDNSVGPIAVGGGFGDDCETGTAAAAEPHPAQRCEPFPAGFVLRHYQGLHGCYPVTGSGVTIGTVHQPWADLSSRLLAVRFDPKSFVPDMATANPATGLPFINHQNLVHTPPVREGVVDKNNVSKPYSLAFAGGEVPSYLELSSSWNGLTNSTAGAVLGMHFNLTAELLCSDTSTQQAVFDWGSSPHACALPHGVAHCSGEFVISIASGNLTAQYLHPGSPYTITTLTVPVEVRVWHSIRLVVAPSGGSVPGSVGATSDWMLAIDGARVATAAAQPEWRLGVPTFSRLGTAAFWPHDRGGAPFSGAIAALTVTPRQLSV